LTHLNTLFIGKVLLHFDAIDSTNSYATHLLAKSDPIDGTVISAAFQKSGRGQIGSGWESESGKNLLLSIILYPSFLNVRRPFIFNQAIALGVHDFLSGQTEKAVWIKWPNDIYIKDKKVAGILIQNTLSGSKIQHTIVGLGINILQNKFPDHLSKATSLSIETGKHPELSSLHEPLFRALEAWYLRLKAGEIHLIQNAYLDRLYRLKQWSNFVRPHTGEVFQGQIVGINESGKLLIEHDGETEVFGTKEVSFMK
jgi:BirA family biotin operon repressor/biotin-[acetyl-CoA-carboxylase] ligase